MPNPRGTYRSVYSRLLDDPDFRRLTSAARLLLLALRLCAESGPASIFRYHEPLAMARTGLALKPLRRAMQELKDSRYIEFDETVVWVRNGLRYEPSMSLADPKHVKAVETRVADLPHSAIVANFCQYYGIVRAFDAPSMPLRSNEPNPIPNTEPEPEPESEPEHAPHASVGPTTSATPTPVAVAMPEDIAQTLGRCRLLGQAPGLRDARYWAAECRANLDLDIPRELYKLEAHLEAHRRRPPNLAAYTHDWLKRAHRDAPQET